MAALLVTAGISAALAAPAEGAPRRTLYVSKLGNNLGGASWQTAFTTIQAALDAVADEGGGHRIVIRPDTYFEAMLSPAHRGAAGAYNELVGDSDGSLGSGTRGWVIIDSGDPDQRGFKSYDWWGTIRSNSQGWSAEHKDPTFSAIGWDRWRFRGLYVTGSDAGLFFDLTDQVKPFSVVVEDCVSIGRAFGGGVASCLSRPEEPITFRRCHLWALDFWGDTAGAYVRVENPAMPEKPDAVFEECVLVGPQCALKSSNFGFHTFSHIRLARCRLIALNFSQPHGTPTDGIIQSVQEGKLLHVDLEDCTLMGYKVFGVIVNKETVGDIRYTTRGDVKAYAQFQQEMPKGIHRLPHWPADVFQHLVPGGGVGSVGSMGSVGRIESQPSYSPHSPYSPHLPYFAAERQIIRRDLCELSPFLWKGRLCHIECVRPGAGGAAAEYFLLFRDAETGEEMGRCGEGHGLASLIVHRGAAHVYASRWEEGTWRDVTLFRSTDLRRWESQVVLRGENEGIFNTSVCKGPDGFVMAYESDDRTYPPFTVKFARSTDLRHWTKAPESTFGTNRYTACPCIRYARGFYYVLYLEHRSPRHVFETYITRSPDLCRWEVSAANPVLRAEGLDEGVNASDPELIEVGGKTLLYFAVGDQLTWMNVKRAVYPGRLADFLESWFASPGVPDWGSAALRADRPE